MAFIDDNDDNNDMDLGFDVESVEPAKFDLIPDGIYSFDVGKVEVKPTKPDSNGVSTGKRLNVELTITTEGFAGRKIFDGINIRNANEKAELIGKQQCAALFASCGVSGNNAGALAGRSGRCKVKTQPEQNGYEARNVVRAYLFDKPADAPSPPAGPPSKAAAPAAAPGEPVKRQPPKFAK